MGDKELGNFIDGFMYVLGKGSCILLYDASKLLVCRIEIVETADCFHDHLLQQSVQVLILKFYQYRL